MGSVRQTQLVRSMVRAVHVVDQHLGDALANQRAAMSTGFPNHTAGAPPARTSSSMVAFDPTSSVHLTTTEASALTHDPARTDRERLQRCVEEAWRWLDEAERLIQRWVQPSPTLDAEGNLVPGRRVAIVDSDIWCTNHLRHGHEVSRAAKGTVCDWCAWFKTQYGHYPGAAVLAARQSNRRLRAVDVAVIETREATATKINSTRSRRSARTPPQVKARLT